MKIMNLLLFVLIISCSLPNTDDDILNTNHDEVDFELNPSIQNQDPIILDLIQSLNFSKLIDKHKVSEIPKYIFSFLEKENSQKFRITDSNRLFQGGCLIFPTRDRDTYKSHMEFQGVKVDSSILMSLPRASL